jgi:uncharacterized protein (TIGR03067 family)
LKDLRVVIKDGKWKIIKGKEVTAEGTYKIVTLDKEVRHADRTVVKGDDAGKTIKQISKVNGDILTVCAAPAEKERPTTFESKSGTGHILGVWRREKK